MKGRSVRSYADQSGHDRFTELFVRNQAAVYRYIVTLVPNRSDADDLFQETNLTLWQKWSHYDTTRPFLPWACGIALNHIRNFWRKRHDVVCILDPDLVAGLSELRFKDNELLEQRQKALTQCIEKLPSRQRQLLHCYYGHSDTIKAIVSREGQRPESLYKRLERIRKFLYECVNRSLIDSEP
mgnify:CR=1 FL=1